jgi:hypothetical protein
VSFATPLFALIGAAASLAVVALHLLAWRRPPVSPLPTARFAPEAPIRTVSRAVRPADLALLALRVLLVLLVAGALAGPRFTARAQGTARVIVVDRSRGGPAGAAATQAARAAFRAGDALVLFDSTVHAVKNPTVDSIVGRGEGNVTGSVSAALVAAIRAGRALQRERASVEIVVVSPFGSDELDAATGSIRRVWPGMVRRVRVAGTPNDPTPRGRAGVRASPGDAVAAALALSGGTSPAGSVRVIRDAITPADSAWAREGGAIVAWPSSGTMAGWQIRSPADTTFGVSVLVAADGVSGNGTRAATVVAPFVRLATAPAGRVVARWQDGEPAATELALGAGCVRAIAIAMPSAGDLAVTPAFRRFAEQLVRPCAGSRSATSVSDSTLSAILPASVSKDSVPRVAASASVPGDSKTAAWMLGVALAAALAELLVRRGANAAG